MLRSVILCAGFLVAGAVAFSAPAQALTMKECGEKYQAAKTANTLNGQTWSEFRKVQCGAETAPSAPSAPASTTAPATTSTTAPANAASTTPAKPAAPAAVDSANVVFPTAIAPEFSTLTPAKGRIKTCAKQWHANKTSGGNGNLKWIQKGGGYWSECNKHLKG
ncbi:hypothetical protein [Labrys monachus]|uniref:Uncharacterized protein n=1 Tax=Labrys monachus TaxID=217067 RepID=A0ABU0FKQ8_9HYPH|nr:hypothetical protein [Labrys monachus]MDQ0395202.1 hypothetical protein [Labrys monachus]